MCSLLALVLCLGNDEGRDEFTRVVYGVVDGLCTLTVAHARLGLTQ